jgi:hypothetical protein
MKPPPISKSKLENEHVTDPGSGSPYIEILDNDNGMKPIPKGPKAMCHGPKFIPNAPSGPKSTSSQPRSLRLTQENLSLFDFGMAAERTVHHRPSSLEVCMSQGDLSQLENSMAEDRTVRQPVSPGGMRKPLISSDNKSGAGEITLPFKLQLAVLATTQQLLEEACFYFAKKWLPGLLQQKRWDVPEKGELHEWWRNIKNRRVPAHAVNFGDLNVEALFRQVGKSSMLLVLLPSGVHHNLSRISKTDSDI